jgi:hypothetical protein
MEEAAENDKESAQSAHASGMNESDNDGILNVTRRLE